MHIHSIDSIRVIAILAVIVIHTEPFSAEIWEHTTFAYVGELIQQLARFAVPFFFVTAGYLLGRKLVDHQYAPDVALRYAKRIGMLYVAWCLIYFVISPGWVLNLLDGNPKPLVWHLANQFDRITATPYIYILKGTRGHLWFLPALLVAVGLVTLCTYKFTIVRCLLPFGALYALGILTGAYGQRVVGFTFDDTFAKAFLYAPFIVAIGVWMASRPVLGLRTAIAVLAIGLFLQLFEAWFLAPNKADIFADFHYYLGTVPLSVGTLAVALANPRMGQQKIAPLGKLVLGVYLVHMLVKDFLMELDKMFAGPIGEIAFPLTILAISLILVFLARRTPMQGLFQ